MIFMRQEGNKKTLLLFCAAVLVLVLILLKFFAPRFLPTVFGSALAPFWRLEYSTKSGAFSSQDKLLAENAELKRRLEELEASTTFVSVLEAENKELKDVLLTASSTHASSTIIYKKVLAPVLSRPPWSAYDELVIDGGADRGFVAGEKVYASSLSPIGKLVQVLPSTSKVMLYSSPGESYQVLIGPSGIPALAEGRGGGEFKASLPRAVTVSTGDFVVVPSLYDKPLAQVKAVISDPTEPFQEVILTPPFNPYSLRWVLVQMP